MTKISKPDYLAKVKLLTTEEKERLLSRMNGKLPRRLERDKISQEEALAIQMEVEDEHLAEWRKVMQKLKKAEVAADSSKPKAAEKTKAAEKVKTAEKTKVTEKTKVVEKVKAPAKPKTVEKPKAAVKAKAPADAATTVKTTADSKPATKNAAAKTPVSKPVKPAKTAKS